MFFWAYQQVFVFEGKRRDGIEKDSTQEQCGKLEGVKYTQVLQSFQDFSDYCKLEFCKFMIAKLRNPGETDSG